MLQIDVSADFKQVERMLKDMPGVVNKAAATALTDTAWKAKQAIEKVMASKFDRPTSYTLNSLRIERARSTKLWATVWVKNRLDAGKGTSPEDYLLPQIYGGGRNPKRFERALQRIGALPPGMYAVPGSAAEMDAYGNISRGQIVQILSYLKAFGEQGYKANMSEKGRARLAKGSKTKRGFAYFVSRGDKGLPRGVWRSTGFGFGSAVQPVLIFVRAPRYNKLIKFDEIVQQVARREFNPRFHAALKAGLAKIQAAA